VTTYCFDNNKQYSYVIGAVIFKKSTLNGMSWGSKNSARWHQLF